MERTKEEIVDFIAETASSVKDAVIVLDCPFIDDLLKIEYLAGLSSEHGLRNLKDFNAIIIFDPSENALNGVFEAKREMAKVYTAYSEKKDENTVYWFDIVSNSEIPSLTIKQDQLESEMVNSNGEPIEDLRKSAEAERLAVIEAYKEAIEENDMLKKENGKLKYYMKEESNKVKDFKEMKEAIEKKNKQLETTIGDLQFEIEVMSNERTEMSEKIKTLTSMIKSVID